MKVHVKNMVCDRCCLAVKNTLQELNLQAHSIALGEIDFADLYGTQLETTVHNALKAKLEAQGFDLLNSKKSQLIEKIKVLCLQYSLRSESNATNNTKEKLSDYLSHKLHHDYNYLSHLFSVVEGLSIEQYFIRQRIEKVKELLIYDELSLSQIPHSSASAVQHI